MTIPELLNHLQACQADVRIEMQYGDAESLAKAQERESAARQAIVDFVGPWTGNTERNRQALAIGLSTLERDESILEAMGE